MRFIELASPLNLTNRQCLHLISVDSDKAARWFRKPGICILNDQWQILRATILKPTGRQPIGHPSTREGAPHLRKTASRWDTAFGMRIRMVCLWDLEYRHAGARAVRERYPDPAWEPPKAVPVNRDAWEFYRCVPQVRSPRCCRDTSRQSDWICAEPRIDRAQ